MALEVTYDTVVEGGEGGRIGLLGLLVFDEQAFKFIAITAASVAGDGQLFEASGEAIGEVSGSRPDMYDEARLRPAWTLLTPVVLAQGVAIGEARLALLEERHYPILGRTAGRLLGRPVLVHLPRRGPVEATLSSTSANFAMFVEDGSRAPVYFFDALDLSVEGGESSWARSGDAGALVTTRDGEVLGIVVSAARERIYAAPVEPLLRELGSCRLLSDEILAKSRTSAASWLLADGAQDNAGADDSGDPPAEVEPGLAPGDEV